MWVLSVKIGKFYMVVFQKKKKKNYDFIFLMLNSILFSDLALFAKPKFNASMISVNIGQILFSRFCKFIQIVCYFKNSDHI